MNPKHTATSPLMAELSGYIAGTLGKPLPAAVAEKARAHLLDTLAAIVSGSTLTSGTRGIDYIRQQGGTPEALVITTDIVTTASNAAFTNGMLAHADETDDSHKASRSHLGCSVVPAALAMAEKENASGAALLRAIVLGYDIGSRILLALSPLRFHQAGHCTHAFAGVFGSAAAAGALARLTPEQTGWALSYAAQQAAGITSWRRAVEHVEKAFVFAGMPARNGVNAATMVASGFTGVNDVFTGAQNFFITFGQEPEPGLLIEGLGERYEILNTTIKKWSVGSPVQSVLDAVHILMQEHRFTHRDIAEIAIRMNPIETDTVDNRAMPDISLQHLVSVLLVDGELTFVSSHDDERMHDPTVVALKKKIALLPDPSVERQRALVTIGLSDRRSISHRATAVRGTPDDPMSKPEITAKALDLIASVWGDARARELIDVLWNIDQIGNIRALRPLLGPPAPMERSSARSKP
jgi:2-methylcitrate dehydratase PrpD